MSVLAHGYCHRALLPESFREQALVLRRFWGRPTRGVQGRALLACFTSFGALRSMYILRCVSRSRWPPRGGFTLFTEPAAFLSFAFFFNSSTSFESPIVCTALPTAPHYSCSKSLQHLQCHTVAHCGVYHELASDAARRTDRVRDQLGRPRGQEGKRRSSD